jgi:hypothetical protein
MAIKVAISKGGASRSAALDALNATKRPQDCGVTFGRDFSSALERRNSRQRAASGEMSNLNGLSFRIKLAH